MTGKASETEWQPHIRNKTRREALAKRFRNSGDPLRMVLVRDMWLTGFNVPSLHTMYVDKPMRDHGLMQAIARVNRVFRDKPGGLVVDYIGLAHELKKALATYTDSGGTGKTAIDQSEAVRAMLEKYEVCCGLFHGFDRSAWTDGSPAERLSLLPPAQEHILAQENGKDRFVKIVRELSQAFALAVPNDEAIRIRDDVAFFQAIRAALTKRATTDKRPQEELDHAVRQIIARGRGAGGRDRHLRRSRSGKARHFHSLGRIPCRSAGYAAAQPCRGTPAKTAERRNRLPAAQEYRASALLRRNAGT